jgi:hypothetical protein
MEDNIWFIFAYVVGTATGWYMFRFSRAQKAKLISNSVDAFLNLLIAGNCVKVKHLADGEVEILTVDEVRSELNDQCLRQDK